MSHSATLFGHDKSIITDRIVYAFIDEPPFGAPGPDGSPVGYDYSVAVEVLSRLGVTQIAHKLVTFADLIPGVAEGMWDINTGMFITPRRSEQVIFSNPIWALVDGFVVPAGNPKQIRSYEDAARDATIVLGVVEGNVQIETALAAGVPESRIRRFKNQHEVVEQVATGAVSAYPGAALAHRGFLNRLGENRVQVVEVKSAAELPLGALSFGKQNARLAKAFNSELVGFLGSKRHEELARQHGLSRAEIDPVLTRRQN